MAYSTRSRPPEPTLAFLTYWYGDVLEQERSDDEARLKRAIASSADGYFGLFPR